jgi:tight adherence protein B
MTAVVQQLAALLKGGRTPARLWDELWVLYGPDNAGDRPAGRSGGPDQTPESYGPMLDPASLTILGAARAAALRGTSVAAAIRGAASGTRPAGRDTLIWGELAACFDTAEASGCPLADVLARFARHLEAEADAEAARRTALAGPRATVRLLTWLPVSGLALGLLLGVDPMTTILGSPWGIMALAAGISLTAAGRLWSAQLVRAAAGAGT